jgi:hypothetical protein
MTETVCDQCGKVFQAKRRDAVHCSPRCARAAYAKSWLPALQRALRYLGREVARLENQVTGTRRRPGRGRRDP